MLGFSRYNYDTFTRDMLMKDTEETRNPGGPAPGQMAPDFQLRSLEGDKIRLSDFRGERNVVLVFGSVTCPMTAGSLRGLNQLYRDFEGEDVEFFFIYVREAHPGDEVRGHRSMEEKIAAAELLRDEEEVEMPILVDDVRGSAHRKYGKLPNPLYIVDKSGRVAFRQLWARPGQAGKALEELLRRQEERGVEHAVVLGGEDRTMTLPYAMLYSHRALERGGQKSLHDFAEAMGMPGKLMLAGSRAARPVTEHPVRALVVAGLTGGVLAAGLVAGGKLRERRRLMRGPYDVHKAPPKNRTGTDYPTVGI